MLSCVTLRAKHCSVEGQKDVLSHLVFRESMKQGIKASHLGIQKPEYVRNRLNLLNSRTEMTQIHDLGYTFKMRHLF